MPLQGKLSMLAFVRCNIHTIMHSYLHKQVFYHSLMCVIIIGWGLWRSNCVQQDSILKSCNWQNGIEDKFYCLLCISLISCLKFLLNSAFSFNIEVIFTIPKFELYCFSGKNSEIIFNPGNNFISVKPFLVPTLFFITSPNELNIFVISLQLQPVLTCISSITFFWL